MRCGAALKTSFKLSANPFKNSRTADAWEPYLSEKQSEVDRLTGKPADAGAKRPRIPPLQAHPRRNRVARAQSRALSWLAQQTIQGIVTTTLELRQRPQSVFTPRKTTRLRSNVCRLSLPRKLRDGSLNRLVSLR